MPPDRRPMPPPLVIAPPGLWRTTPPALFAPILGVFGLGLLLRVVAEAWGSDLLAGMAEAVLGATVLLHAFAVVAYAAKPIRRFGALIEDMGTLPGRSGIAAALAATHLSAAALVPYAPGLALGMVLGTLGAQVLYMAGLLTLMARGPVEGRAVSPVFHLIFVGYVLAPFALVPLGWSGLSAVLFWVGLTVAGTIGARGLPRAPATPAPLRPTLAIHLAPASVLASVAALLGWPGIALALAVLAVGLALGLLARVRWLTAAGFSPFWGAFTFPMAAFGAALLRGMEGPGLVPATGVAVLASGFIPYVAWRVLKDWPGGALARKTNAATA